MFAFKLFFLPIT